MADSRINSTCVAMLGKRHACLRPPLAKNIVIRYVPLVNSSNMLNILSWLLIDLYPIMINKGQSTKHFNINDQDCLTFSLVANTTNIFVSKIPHQHRKIVLHKNVFITF